MVGDDSDLRPGELRIADEADGPHHTLVLSGELSIETGPQLMREILALCESRASQIALDLGKLDFVDSSGVRAVADVEQFCRDRGCEFSLAPGHQKIQRLYELVGLLQPREQPPPA
jgi:anti-anti-sigma factor